MGKLLGQKFAQLLTTGVRQISIRESKPIGVVQDELGYALGRSGGSAVEYWRAGHVPPTDHDIKTLAREIMERGRLDQEWLEQFLCSAGRSDLIKPCLDLFPSSPKDVSKSAGFTFASNGYNRAHEDCLLPNTTASFIVGPPVTHPRNFFGREYELKRIFDLWKQFPLQNVAVLGIKRSGKTSLLHYLKTITTAPSAQLRPNQRASWLPPLEDYRWVMVDFQDARMCSPQRLLRHILTSLKLPVPDPCDLPNFIDVVSQQLQTPAIILMDEVDAGLTSPELDQRFWWGLRSLGTNLTEGKLGFLLTSHEPLAQLAQQQGKLSPFFNIFGHTFTLGPLTEAEAQEFIASSPLPFAPADVEWIQVQSKRWPCLLQVLCHARLVALQNGQTDNTWQEEGLRQIMPFQHLLAI